MNKEVDARLTTSDETLIVQTRAGDQGAFAELWRRHFRSGARVARQFTSSIDADDLVSEAYTRIYQRVLAGGGPTGAFRPYLYTTIRNLASTWGAASKDVQVDEIADFEDPATIDDPAAIALDRTLTARAFRSLPERWQAVLWYTEVEGMDPHEVAPVLGMTANGVAALSYRAREGLRKAWLQAHINDASASGECRWAISRVGEHARNSLTARDTERLEFHLTTCAKCAIITEEVDEVGSRLAFVMLPILLGGVAGGTLLASWGSAGGAMAATVSFVPAVPTSIASGAALGSGATAASALGFFGVATAPIALVGTLALAVAVSGSVVAAGPLSGEQTTTTSQGESTEASIGGSPDSASERPIRADDPVNLGDLPVAGTNGVDSVTNDAGGIVGGVTEVVSDVDDLVDSVVDTVTGGVAPPGHTAPGGVVGADISLNLTGTGTPGANLSLQTAGQVYATTIVDSNGNWSLAVAAVPGGLASLDLVQQVDRTYLKSLLPGGGTLAALLGTVDSLINALVKPLQLSSGASGVTINLLG